MSLAARLADKSNELFTPVIARFKYSKKDIETVPYDIIVKTVRRILN